MIVESWAIKAVRKKAKVDSLKQLFREINYDPARADGWMMKEARAILGDSQFIEKGDKDD